MAVRKKIAFKYIKVFTFVQPVKNGLECWITKLQRKCKMIHPVTKERELKNTLSFNIDRYRFRFKCKYAKRSK